MKISTTTIVLGVLGLGVIGTAIYLITKPKNEESFDLKNSLDSSSQRSNASVGEEESEESEESDGTFISQNKKDLKGKEKRQYKRDVKQICKEKYGSGKDYRQCKSRVGKGGVPFDGVYSQAIGKNVFDPELLTDI